MCVKSEEYRSPVASNNCLECLCSGFPFKFISAKMLALVKYVCVYIYMYVHIILSCTCIRIWHMTLILNYIDICVDIDVGDGDVDHREGGGR